MPDGRPGEHPFTDIVHLGLATFTPEIDNLVRELAQMPGFDEFKDKVDEILWNNWPIWTGVTPDFDLIHSKLMIMKHWLNAGKSK